MNVSFTLLLIIALIPSSLASRYLLFDPAPADLHIPLHMQPSVPPHLKSSQTIWPNFNEAPAFRNSKECIATTSLYYSNNREEDDLCDILSMHVAMTLDVAYIRGSVAAILSILKHANCPENVVFHFLASDSMNKLTRIMKLTFPYLRFKVYHFDENLVKGRISPSIRDALEQPLNYARTYMPDILPSCIKRIVYLDSDLIILDDIAELWDTDLDSHPLGAPEYCHANFTKYFTDTFWVDMTLSAVFDGRNPCYFNTGVMVMDLEMWRFWGYTKAIEEWMDVQKEMRIYELGSLPPFLIVFAGDVKPIEHRWNQHGLGGDNVKDSCRGLHRGRVSLLHWSGKGKPWVRLDKHMPCPLDSLWSPYDLVASL